MSYQFHPTIIILEFMFFTGLLVCLAIFFIPVIHDILFDSDIQAQVQDDFVRSAITQLWTWTIVFFIGGMAGNVIWFVRAMQARQAEVRQF